MQQPAPPRNLGFGCIAFDPRDGDSQQSDANEFNGQET